MDIDVNSSIIANGIKSKYMTWIGKIGCAKKNIFHKYNYLSQENFKCGENNVGRPSQQ